jgi:hypothetical protein
MTSFPGGAELLEVRVNYLWFFHHAGVDLIFNVVQYAAQELALGTIRGAGRIAASHMTPEQAGVSESTMLALLGHMSRATLER